MLYDVCMFVLYLMLVTYRTLSYRIVLSPPRTAEEMIDMLGEATERELDEGGNSCVHVSHLYVLYLMLVCMYRMYVSYVCNVHVSGV